MSKVVTMGEIMLRLSTPNNEKFIQADEFDINYGGGEANVAVSLANYGHEAEFVTAVPANPIGECAVAALRKYGVETKNIVKTAAGAEADGVTIDTDSLVSMNMWGLTPDFLTVLEEGFKEFFEKEVVQNPLKAEYLIPTFIGELLSESKMSVKVLRSNDTWYGMTYHEDVVSVKDSFKKMLEKGLYKADLFSDL